MSITTIHQQDFNDNAGLVKMFDISLIKLHCLSEHFGKTFNLTLVIVSEAQYQHRASNAIKTNLEGKPI